LFHEGLRNQLLVREDWTPLLRQVRHWTLSWASSVSVSFLQYISASVFKVTAFQQDSPRGIQRTICVSVSVDLQATVTSLISLT
jgi:hypothetical protein